eukprot:763940-Hanusia_phi.AAC.17
MSSIKAEGEGGEGGEGRRGEERRGGKEKMKGEVTSQDQDETTRAEGREVKCRTRFNMNKRNFKEIIKEKKKVVIVSISETTIREILSKREVKPARREEWGRNSSANCRDLVLSHLLSHPAYRFEEKVCKLASYNRSLLSDHVVKTMNTKGARMEALRTIVSLAALLAIGIILASLQYGQQSSETDILLKKAEINGGRLELWLEHCLIPSSAANPKKSTVHKAASKKMEAKKALLHPAHPATVVSKHGDEVDKVKKYISHVAEQDANVRDQVREVIKEAESTEKEQPKASKGEQGQESSCRAVPVQARVCFEADCVSGNCQRTLSRSWRRPGKLVGLQMRLLARRPRQRPRGRRGGRERKQMVKSFICSYYDQLRKEMFARVKAKQERARKVGVEIGKDYTEQEQILIASKNMSASQDNKKLLNDLDAIYSE